MDAIGKGWFSELSPSPPTDSGDGVNGNNSGTGLWEGQAFSLEVDEVLYHKRSKYQDVLAFKSKTYGNVLVLDGVIQCTERDEFAYQELLAHLPMCSHPNPKKVLIIGGGDGGILREVLKHDCVESATLCEIDNDVIEVSKKYLPGMAKSFSHPKAVVHVGDGFEFMRNHSNEFDVIITDSSDPIGPAQSLFEDAYYKLVHDALTENGILASQAESIWLHLNLIADMTKFCREIYKSVAYAYGSVPTYPSGVMGYMLCSKATADLTIPCRRLSEEQLEKMNMRYYNPEVHEAAFVLPQFAREALE